MRLSRKNSIEQETAEGAENRDSVEVAISELARCSPNSGFYAFASITARLHPVLCFLCSLLFQFHCYS